MATFAVDTSFLNQPAPKQQTLGDLVNMAGGIQNYQQAQQLNPVQLENAQTVLQQNKLGLQKAQALTQPEIEAGLAKSQGEVFELKKKFADDILQSHNAMLQSNALKTGNAKEFKSLLRDERERLIDKGIPAHIAETEFSKIISAVDDPGKGLPYVQQRLGVGLRANISPAQLQSNISGQQVTGEKTPQGNPTVVEVNPVTGERVQKELPTTGVMRVLPGESTETINAMQAERNDAKNAAMMANPALNNVKTVRKYLDLAQTGKYSESISGLESVFGNLAGDTASEKAASARDIIEKNIADLAAQKNLVGGGKFVADLQNAQQSIASAGKNPTAILKSMEQLEPLIQHTQNYYQGLEAAISKNPDLGIQVKRAYDAKMQNAFDVNALNFYNAYESGNLEKYKKEHNITPKEQTKLINQLEKYNKLLNGDIK
jgi:hypothetical protein